MNIRSKHVPTRLLALVFLGFLCIGAAGDLQKPAVAPLNPYFVEFQRAIERKVAFLPGGAFYPDPAEQKGEVHGGSRFIRLCFTFADDEQIDEGCRRLAAVLAG